MNYLVDPSGRWWRWPSETLAEKLGYPDPDFDLAGYAARNLGYVWLLLEDSATFLQFRAGMISPACLESLRPYLRKAVATRPVGLVFYAGGWLEEAHISAETLIPRMEELAPLRDPRMRDLFIRYELQPQEWLQKNNHDLTGLFLLWKDAGGIFSSAVENYLRHTGLTERTVVLRPDQSGDLFVQNSGSGFTVYDQFSFHKASDRKIEDQPDRMYGQWVRESYRASLVSGNPQIDDIDAIIEQPGHDHRRRRYQRVILRWNLPNDGVILTGSSQLKPDISIPLDVGTDNIRH